MGWYDALKDGIEVARKADNLEVMKQLLDAQQETLDLVEENRELKNRIRALEERQATSDSLTFKENAYWRNGDEGPYCSKCWDAEAKLIRLHQIKDHYPQCPNCKISARTEIKQRTARELRPSRWLNR